MHPSTLFDINGKVALVTGGAGGIGEVVSRALAAAGARVAIAGHDEAKAAALAGELTNQGHEGLGAGFDAGSVASTHAMVERVAAHFGRVDILVNCVGRNREEPVDSVTEAAFDLVTTINLKAPMFIAQAVARQMVAQGGGGRQVHVGSVRSQLALRGRGYAAYCAAKGGLVVLCRQLAAELAPHQITVNVVAPTFVRTPQVADMLGDPTFYEPLVARIPLGRIAEPEDVMAAILFMVAPASSFITGQVLYVDGGITATQ